MLETRDRDAAKRFLQTVLYLWIFGDNVEERLGHLRLLLFYLTGGLAASLAHVFVTVAFGGNALTLCLS